MSKMSKISRILLALGVACCVTACDTGWLSKLGVDDPGSLFESAGGVVNKKTPQVSKQEKLVVNKVEFSPDYKTFSVWTGVADDIGPYALTDSTAVRIEVEEYLDGIRTARNVTPRLVKAWNTDSDHIEKLGVKVLVLADLSLPEELVDAERQAVEEIQTAFAADNLYVSFLSNANVSPNREVTKYLLSTYFKPWSTRKCLYRAILNKMSELAKGGAPWADATAVKLVVFSDGKVYGKDDEPMDPEHFRLENELLHSKVLKGKNVSVYYVNFGQEEENAESRESTDVLTTLCESTGGAYLPKFNWTLLENTMLGNGFRMDMTNRFDFENPDKKVYRGGDDILRLKFYSMADGKLVASASTHIKEGSLYKPIIVNGVPVDLVIYQGAAVTALLLLLIYLIFQYIVPAIRYRIFLKKYVVQYTGKNMMLEGVTVADRCYLCKAPFEKGDEIVVKCEHTMHKACWDENEYHCPEYGRHCQHGSHFYDRENLGDRRNASFYLRWLVMAVVAALLAWVCFTIWSEVRPRHLLEVLMTGDKYALDKYGIHLNQLPSYGFMIGFFLTFGISSLAFRQKQFRNYLGFFLRALLAGIGSFVLYLLMSAACIALHVSESSLLVNLIPWILSSILIAFVGTYGTRVKLRKSIILIAIGVSLVSLYVWSSLYMLIGVDFRVLLLYSYLIYAIGMAAAIASAAPRSEHYFLHVQGPVKTMDIALYKWFRSNPRMVVTIGRSVDCSLQLTWDLKGQVAPIHAAIRMRKGILQLIALEKGVWANGKYLRVGGRVKLSHGMEFVIGKTLFTYQEKDI